MITVDNHEWKALAEKIMVGDKQIVAVYAGGKKVYPEEQNKLVYYMYFSIPYTVSAYDPRPVNQVGAYLSLNAGEKNIHKVAWVIDFDNITDYIFVTLENYEQANYEMKHVAYVADSGDIIFERTQYAKTLVQNASGAKYYYSTNAYMSCADTNHHALIDYRTGGSGTGNSVMYIPFGNVQSAINTAIRYVLD